MKTPSVRRAVELCKKNPVSDALPRGSFVQLWADALFVVHRASFSNVCPVDFHASPPAAADEVQAASSRSAPAIPHVDVTNFAQISCDVQPRPTPKTLVTRSSQPVLNTMHYAPYREKYDRDACPNFSLYVFTFGDLSAEISRLQDEVALCRQRIASYPTRSRECVPPWTVTRDSAPSFKAEKKKANLDWRRV